MSDPYRCSKCGTSFDESVLRVETTHAPTPSVTVRCLVRYCGHSVTRPTLTEALQEMGKGEEKK